MEQNNDAIELLDYIHRGAFCVKDGVILKVNEAAQKRNITEGSDIYALLKTGKTEYRMFCGGCLYLTLDLGGTPWGASVTRTKNFDVFVLEQDEDQSELQAMALAAQELRQPLTNIMVVADSLFPIACDPDDPEAQQQAARINRGLFQMHRIINNMSDAYRYCQDTSSRQETRNITALLEETFQASASLLESAGITLRYTGLQESIYCLADEEKLERAVSNLLSNAIKFAPKNGCIDAKLSRTGSMLYLTVQDNGDGIAPNLRSQIFSRYLREPGIEDSRYGIGLGMVLVRAAATAHGGTVLMEQSPEFGTRLTLTIPIRQSSESIVKSNTLSIDYAGGRDRRLLELSDSLPADAYRFHKPD